MTIGYVGAGTFAGSTAGTVGGSGPAGAVGDLALSFWGHKPASAVGTVLSDEILLGAIASGTIAAGNDTGSVRATAAGRIAPSATGQSLSMTVTSPNVIGIQPLRFSKDAASGWNLSNLDLADTDEALTAVSATGVATAGQFASGDWVVISAVIKSDAINHTSQSLSIPGCTLGTITWLAKGTTTAGGDLAMYVGYAQITAGSSTASTVTYAATSSSSGGSATACNLVRLREIVPPNPPTNLTAIGDADSINLDWDAPASGTTPTSYNVYRDSGADLVAGDNATFTSGVGSWTTTTAGTLSHNVDALRMVSTGTAAMRAELAGTAVVVGRTYKATAQVRNVSGARHAGIQLRFFDSGGTELSTTGSVAYSLPTSSYSAREVVGVAPANAATVKVHLWSNQGTAATGDTHEWDNVSLVETSNITSVAAPTTAYDDTSAATNIAYTYFVRSVFSGLESVDSNSVTARLGAPVLPHMKGIADRRVRMQAVARASYW